MVYVLLVGRDQLVAAARTGGALIGAAFAAGARSSCGPGAAMAGSQEGGRTVSAVSPEAG
jgi:hypothetical protein